MPCATDLRLTRLAHMEDDLATRFLHVLSNDAVPVLADGLRDAEGLARVLVVEDFQLRLNRLGKLAGLPPVELGSIYTPQGPATRGCTVL